MNRILVEKEEIRPDGTVSLTDNRAEHIRTILHGTVGQELRTGEVNGLIGTSRIESITGQEVVISVFHTQKAIEPWIDLLLAMPRPKVMKRLWPQLATLGVRRLFLLEAEKVEKCYFGCRTLVNQNYRSILIEGLMQGGTSRLPEVTVIRKMHSFFRKEFDTLFQKQSVRLIAHPSENNKPTPLPTILPGQIPALAIGPEGGWTDDEVALFCSHGFSPFSLGCRILKTETACVGLLSILGYHLSLETH